jgi:hypothetical protein
MNNFLAQLKLRQAAHEARPKAKPVSEMNEAELDEAVAQAKQEVLASKREELQASREAAAEAKARPRFLSKRRRPTWR